MNFLGIHPRLGSINHQICNNLKDQMLIKICENSDIGLMTARQQACSRRAATNLHIVRYLCVGYLPYLTGPQRVSPSKSNNDKIVEKKACLATWYHWNEKCNQRLSKVKHKTFP